MAEASVVTTPERVSREARLHRIQQAAEMLDRLMDADEEEQRETLELLRKALDERQRSRRETSGDIFGGNGARRTPGTQPAGRLQKPSDQEQEEMNRRAIEVLRSFREEDAEEQRVTGEILMRALGRDRSSYRKLFPDR